MTGYIWNMKRRTIDSGKARRPMGLKKTKISDGLYTSALLYMKFLLVWAFVMVADFIVEFRFEYLWPLWLLFRSAFDSFRYQGMLFCILFCCVSIASDVICYLFIPVQWLYLAASTYVWVQYVWHTDRGICLPTVSLWILFVYIETSLRLRDFKCLPFHLDLCRPFAAHCIGYPVVTLGFGCKSYVSYKLRLRKQKEVQKENEFYFQLLQQALPAEQVQQLQPDTTKGTSKQDEANMVLLPNASTELSKKPSSSNNSNSRPDSDLTVSCFGSVQLTNGSISNSSKELSKQFDIGSSQDGSLDNYEFIENSFGGSRNASQSSINDFKDDNTTIDPNTKVYKTTARNTLQLAGLKDNVATASSLKKAKSNNTVYQNNRDDPITRLELDAKRAKAELQSSRNTEQELRCQINSLIAADKATKSEIHQLRQDNESLQVKLHNLVTSRQQDKQTLAALERKLLEERKAKTTIEQQLQAEKKRKADDAAAAKAAAAVATPPAPRNECTEGCRSRRMELENELKQINWEMKRRDEQIHMLEHETQMLRQYKEAQSETEVLMSALIAMREKNAHLETNLSAETRLKMDLFSALGETKRQIEIQHSLLLTKDGEINDLQTKVAEVMALVPSTSGFGAMCTDTPPHFSAAFTSHNMMGSGVVLSKSNLNPNASDYQPKVSM
jgi:hypothetical protein